MKPTLEALFQDHQAFIKKAVSLNLFPDKKNCSVTFDPTQKTTIVASFINDVEFIQQSIDQQCQNSIAISKHLFELKRILEGAGKSYVDSSVIQQLYSYFPDVTTQEIFTTYETNRKKSGILDYVSRYWDNPNQPLVDAVTKKISQYSKSSFDEISKEVQDHSKKLASWLPDSCDECLIVLFKKVSVIHAFSQELEGLFFSLNKLDNDESRLNCFNSQSTFLEKSYEQIYSNAKIDVEINRLNVYFTFFKQWCSSPNGNSNETADLIDKKKKDLEDIQKALTALKDTSTKKVNELNILEQLYGYRVSLNQLKKRLLVASDTKTIDLIEEFNRTKTVFKEIPNTKAVQDVYQSCVQAEALVQRVYEDTRNTVYNNDKRNLEETLKNLNQKKPSEYKSIYQNVKKFKSTYQPTQSPLDELTNFESMLEFKMNAHAAKVQLFTDILKEFYGTDEHKISGRFGTYLSQCEKEAGFWLKDFFRSLLEFLFGVFGYQSDWSARKQYIRDLRETMKDQRDNEDTGASVTDVINMIETKGIARFKPRTDISDEYEKSLKAILVDLKSKLQALADVSKPSTNASPIPNL